MKSEMKMINNLKNIYGEDVPIGAGDYSQPNMKYQTPTKGRGFRKLLHNHGFTVGLAHEYNTSCTCSTCGNKLEYFKYEIPGRPEKISIYL